MSDYPIVDLSTDALLTTTRSVRKRLDLTKPVPIGLIRECLEIAVQAPTSSNVQNWSFIVVTDAEQRRAIGDVYRRIWDISSCPLSRSPIGSRTTPCAMLSSAKCPTVRRISPSTSAKSPS